MKPYVIDGGILIKRMAAVLVAGLFVGAAAACSSCSVFSILAERWPKS